MDGTLSTNRRRYRIGPSRRAAATAMKMGGMPNPLLKNSHGGSNWRGHDFADSEKRPIRIRACLFRRAV